MRMIRDFTPEDAAGLAKCINESEGGWPGGITHGLEHTAKHIMEDYERELSLTWLIAVDDQNQVAGISTLHPHFEDPEAAYLGFLNVSDTFRKKGYGKALLIESVERVAAHGYKRLFLGTWAGNLNAVPVYKRTGFFWRPDTNVWMDNYIPTVLRLPITQSFFQKHNWFETYVRKIEVKPDEMEHRGLRVYILRWQKESDFLRVIIDRESRGPTLIETNEVLVECWVADPDPVLGIPLPVEWTIQNKNPTQTLHPRLTIKLPKGFQFVEEPQSEVTLAPGEMVTLKGSIQGDVRAIPPSKDKAALVLKSEFILGNIPVELNTGLRIQHPIQVSTVPPSIWCRPGNQLKLGISLKNNLKKHAQGTIFLQVPRGLRVKQKQYEITFEPEGYSGLDVEVFVDSSLHTKALPIRLHAELQVNGQLLRTRRETIYLHCLGQGGVLVTPVDDKRRLQVHTEILHFSINLEKGAHIDRLANRLTGRVHIRSHCRDSVGPPFWPSEQMRTRFKYRIEHPGRESARIVTWMQSKRYPGLEFSKTYAILGNSPNLGIEYGFDNTNPNKTYKLRILMGSIPGLWDHLHVLPLRGGVLREEFIEDEFFASSREVPKKREDWEETWYCAERPHKGDVTAVLCHPSIFYEAVGRSFVDFQLQVPPLHPKKKITLPPVYLVTGLGTWHHIRRLWHQYYSPHPEKILTELQPLSAVDVRTENQPLLREAKSQVTIPIQISHLVHRPLEGKLYFTAPKGWQIHPRSKKFKDLKRETPISIPLTLTAKPETTPKPGIVSVHTKIKTSLCDYHIDVPTILHRRPGTVSVSQSREQNQDIYIIDNGTYQVKIAPRFAGSVFAWINKKTGTNYLKTSFPKAGPMMWFNPWYGGFRFDPFPPNRNSWEETKLHLETWSAKKVQRNEWQGVNLSVTPGKQEKLLKGFQFELQVLTQPESNILALNGRIHNLTQAPRQIYYQTKIGVPSEGSPAGLETIIPRATTTYRRRRVTQHSWPTSSQSYLGVEHMKDDSTLLYITKQKPAQELYLGDLAPDLIRILYETRLEIPAKGMKELATFLVVTKAPWKEAKNYSILSNLTL